MVDETRNAKLAQLARDWAKSQEELVLKHGAPLGARQLADAKRVNVQNPARVRLLVVDRISMPENAELAEAANRAQIITHASLAVTVGHAIMIRADHWKDRELILHQLAHVAQSERAGGLIPYVEQYMHDRSTCADFSIGTFEEEARRLAREICAADEAKSPKTTTR